MEEDKTDKGHDGMACPNCGCKHLRAIWTRPRKNGTTRSRSCRACGRRIITRETIKKEDEDEN